MPHRWRRGGGDAAPAHAREANPAPAHARRMPGAGRFGQGRSEQGVPKRMRPERMRAEREDPERRRSRPKLRVPSPADDPGWLIPLAASVVAAVCIVAIAIPAALVSGGSAPDAELSAEVREAPVEGDAAADTADAGTLLARDTLAFGTDLAASADTLGRAATTLRQAVDAIHAAGYQVGYYVATPDGQEVAAYDADRIFYGASSIKGPFVLQAFGDGVPEGYRGLVESTIQWSDNDSYYELRALRGYDVLTEQLALAGITEITPYESYAWMSPRQLVQLWEMELGPLSLEGEPGDWLRRVFSGTSNSALGALPAGGVVPVASAYSKGGWIEDGDFHCTVDAGVITFAAPDGEGSGPTYVIAAMTDKGEDFEALANVENALVAYLAARNGLD